jgi:hypothetical protein
VVTLVVLLLVVGLGILMAVQGWSAYTHLRAVADRGPEVRQQVVNGEQRLLRASVEAVARDSGKARKALSGPHWDAASKIPWLGGNVGALQGLTEAADELSRGTLPELVKVAEVVEPGDLKPQDGQVALAPIRKSRPYLQAAAGSARTADERLDRVDPEGLLPLLQPRFEEAGESVDALNRLVSVAADVSRILPSVLGAEGPRRYLVLVQNNAEPRALGGITGSVLELRASGGRVQLVGSRPGSSFGDLGRPILPLSPGERALDGPALGRYMLNVTATPDFPRATQLASAMWTRETGDRVDGAVAIDPVTLSERLRVTGPVEVPRGRTLDADNASEFLLNGVYLDIADLEEQDRYFSQVAAAIFDHFIGAEVELTDTLQALADMTEEGRFRFWSRYRPEQAVVAGTRVAGQLRGERAGDHVVGVYLHDRTQSKMGFYQDMDVVAETSCADAGDRIRVEVTLASRAPQNAQELPRQVTGYGTVVPPGRIASQLFVYAPTGTRITGFTTTAGPERAKVTRHGGLDVATWPITLTPSQTVRVTYDIEGSLEGATVVQTTPGPTRHRFSHSASSCES